MSTHEGEVKKSSEVKDEGGKKKSTQVKHDEEIKRRGRITTKDIQRQQLDKLMAEPVSVCIMIMIVINYIICMRGI